MRVKCLYNTLNDNGSCYNRKFHSSNENNYLFLEENKLYLVMGIIYGINELSFMIDVQRSVYDCPYQLFEIVDNNIPPDWKLGLFEKSDLYENIISIIGYKELVEVEKSYLDLYEGEENALLTYFKRKIELEKYYEDLELLK